MPSVALAPSRELKRLAVRMEWGFSAYAESRGMVASGSKWESFRHSWVLSNLTLRHAEATTLMARTDVAHAPTAWVTARAAVESAGRCLWLLEPDDEWERESRWVAFVREGARLGERRQFEGIAGFTENAKQLSDFASAVEAKLPSGTIVPAIPTADSMLEPLAPRLAAFYVLASQYTHGAEYATRSFRSHLGDAAVYGELSEEGDWPVPLQQVWQAFKATAVRLMLLTNTAVPERLALVDVQIDNAFGEFLSEKAGVFDQGRENIRSSFPLRGSRKSD